MHSMVWGRRSDCIYIRLSGGVDVVIKDTPIIEYQIPSSNVAMRRRETAAQRAQRKNRGTPWVPELHPGYFWQKGVVQCFHN